MSAGNAIWLAGKSWNIRSWFAALCLPPLIALGGCTSSQVRTTAQCDLGPVAEAQRAPVEGDALVPDIPGSTEPMPLDAVSLTDENITHRLVVQSTGGERAETGALRAWSRFVNCTDHDLALEGRTHFLNDEHREVEQVTAWNPFFLPAKAVGTYESVSTSDEAQTFLIEIREKR